MSCLGLAVFVTLCVVVSGESGETKWVYAHSGQLKADDAAQKDTWGGLCVSGKEQSPINIVTANLPKPSKPVISTHFNTTETYLKTTDHGFQLHETSNVQYVYNNSSKNWLSELNTSKGFSMFGGSKYEFYQVHWHTPSENTINGQHFALEAHFVHQLSDAALVGTLHRLAVIGLLYELGNDNECNAILDQFWSDFSDESGINSYTGPDFDLNSMVEGVLAKGYWHWYGSLTTPPCTEGVSWNLLKSPLKVCQRQVTKLSAALNKTQNGISFNNRVTQPLFGRVVVDVSPDGLDSPPIVSNTALESGHWVYAADGGNESSDADQDATWGGGLCVAGHEQSPINVDTAKVIDAAGPTISTNYSSSPAYVKDTGHGFQLFETMPNYTVLDNNGNVTSSNRSDKGYAKIGDERYNFYQVHWHTPSENTIDGKHFAIEAHFVHQLNDPALVKSLHRLAVVALMYELGSVSDCNAFLEKFWDSFPVNGGTAPYNGSVLDLNEHLTGSLGGGYYHWYGSLTTPPCTEGVSWNLLISRQKVCPRQVEKLELALRTSQDGVGFNNRAVQPLYARVVTRTPSDTTTTSSTIAFVGTPTISSTIALDGTPTTSSTIALNGTPTTSSTAKPTVSSSQGILRVSLASVALSLLAMNLVMWNSHMLLHEIRN